MAERSPPPIDVPILGVPTRFLVTDETLRAHVEETFGAWRAVARRPDLVSAARVEVELVLRPAAGDDAAAPVRYLRPRAGELVVRTPGSEGVAHLDRGRVSARVSPELAAGTAHFRYAFLSALTLSAVTVHDRIPIHAAAVASGDTALLLHGPSGAGKSSLVLAAARAGLRALSEDVVYAEVRRGPRLWGMPGPVHLLEGGLRFFPDLSWGAPVVRSSGALKLAVATPTRADELPVAHRCGTCMLRPSHGRPALEPVPIEEVRAVLAGNRESGFDLFAAEAGSAADLVAGAGAWRLSVGSDPHAAARLLADLLREIGT